MKTPPVRALIALCVGMTLVPPCLAADPPASFPNRVRADAHSFAHTVADESRLFGHTVAEKSTHAGHAIADAARKLGMDVKSGTHEIKAAVTHDASKPKD